jgi:signal transduction histidine kinase
VINVQLEKALTFREKRPLEAERAVSDAKRLASEALQDVRRSISALRTTDELPTFIPLISKLVEHVQSEQCPITLHIAGDEAYCSRQSLMTLYRAVQEGLTNIQKHAGASQVWVDLSFGEQEATLVLRDNGRGFDPTNPQKEGSERGYGLQGVQERLEFVGGSLKVESTPDWGTILVVQIPGNESSQSNHGREENK